MQAEPPLTDGGRAFARGAVKSAVHELEPAVRRSPGRLDDRAQQAALMPPSAPPNRLYPLPPT